MNDLIRKATVWIARVLSAKLPGLSPDWWQKLVLDRLSFHQQRTARERGLKTLEQLDFAALLRVIDQNWFELSGLLGLPREARSWVKELHSVRNKWAHLSAESMPASETYRDTDTLGRLLSALGADADTMETVESIKTAALAAVAGAESPLGKGSMGPEKAPSRASTSLFKVGDLVTLRANPEVLLPVVEVIPGTADCRYRVFQNNTKVTYYESQLQAAVGAKGERKLLTASELRAHLTSLQILSPSTANLFSLRSGRVQFIPYQYRPVLRLIRADRPRLLIADEVGVGKTIEAGLIIKELRARMEITSILVICPKSLVAERKWHMEMRRFDEHFIELDGTLLRHCLRETDLEGEWPAQYAKAILPFSLFDSDLIVGTSDDGKKKNQGLLALDPPPKFDLVIVDEAHHIRNSGTYAHQGARYLCDNAQAVILLTATPVQMGSDDLFTLLNVLRPDLVIDRASFQQMAEPNPHINATVQQCRAAGEGWQNRARDCLNEVARTEWGRLFVRESPAFQGIFDQLCEGSLKDADRVALTRTMEELYTFSHLVNRTRRRDIGEFTTRKPETVTIDFTSDQQRLHDGLLGVIERILERCHGQQNVKFMMTTIRRQAASCLYGLAPFLSDILRGKLNRLELMEATDGEEEADYGFVPQIKADIESLIEQARNLGPHDPKVEAFVKILLDNRNRASNKALVFSTFHHTLAYLDAHARRANVRVGLVHGNVPEDERASLRRRFGLPKEETDAIDVLLSSEVGCEGLDFQFCDLLVNYDLPWNPMRIEQRIGRIDRYGQKSPAVVIVNFVTPGTVDAEIYERCLWRIGVFHHAVGGSEEILGAITQELHDIAESFDLNAEERTKRLQQLADNAIRKVREEQELETTQSSLFGLDVPKQSWRDGIAAAESIWLSPAAIRHAVMTYLGLRIGSDAEHLLGEKPIKTLRLNQEARALLLADYRTLNRPMEPIARDWEKWLKGSQPTLAVTFEQEAAAENPKTVHLSLLHPLVRQAARFLDMTEPKYISLTLRSNCVPQGAHHFALYRWTKHGIKPDESLIVVAAQPQLEDSLLEILRHVDQPGSAPLPDEAQCDALDARHHSKWAEARANHMAQNQELAEHRIQSLTVSHRARCNALADQVARATNDKIRLMKENELARANADFSRRMTELQQAANTGDIRATPVVLRTISVIG